VYAAAGTYERIGVKAGVDVYGGYDPRTWKRSLTLVTEISGAAAAQTWRGIGGSIGQFGAPGMGGRPRMRPWTT
jgi:hypothetical protein